MTTLADATTALEALKAHCEATCAAANAAVADIDADALHAALVAHHVIRHGERAFVTAVTAGPLRFLDERFIAEVDRVVQAGGDPAEVAGADPEHVATLQAAHEAHTEHAAGLAAAYAEFATATAQDAAAAAAAGVATGATGATGAAPPPSAPPAEASAPETATPTPEEHAAAAAPPAGPTA